MSSIAFLGLGAMGARMAVHLVQAGHDVTVWNRDETKATSLRDAGATVAASPRAAAAGAEFVIAMVRDDAASRHVWLDHSAGALDAMRPDAVAIECSTLGLDWVRELAARCAAHDHAFLDAPVVGSRPQAEQRQLIFLAGGRPEILSRAEPILSRLGGAIHHAGSSGAGTLTKLAVNALFAVQVSALAELLETVRRQGFDPARALDILSATPVASPAAAGAGRAMLSDAFAPMFPIELVEKDLAYAVAASGRADAASVIAACRALFAAAGRAGFGADNLTAIIRLHRD
jgi:3-hydroxyisobutyrate dehydrogenase